MFGMLPIYHLAAGALNVAPVTGIINQVLTATQVIGVSTGGLAAVFGGLMQTNMFHSEGAHQKGKDVMRYGIYGMIAMGVGPALMKALAGAAGAAGALHGIRLM